MEAVCQEIKFTDADVVNKDDFIPAGECNPHNVRPWLLHDHGTVLCVVFADSLQDVLDIAADEGKLGGFQLDPTDVSTRDDYMTTDFAEADAGLDPTCPECVFGGVNFWWRMGKTPTFLGNASEPFDTDSLDYIELPNPPFSFCALFAARTGDNSPSFRRHDLRGAELGVV